MAQFVLKEAKDEYLDETAKDLVQFVLKETKDEYLDETAKDLVQFVLKETKDEYLDETAKDLTKKGERSTGKTILSSCPAPKVNYIFETSSKFVFFSEKGLIIFVKHKLKTYIFLKIIIVEKENKVIVNAV